MSKKPHTDTKAETAAADDPVTVEVREILYGPEEQVRAYAHALNSGKAPSAELVDKLRGTTTSFENIDRAIKLGRMLERKSHESKG